MSAAGGKLAGGWASCARCGDRGGMTEPLPELLDVKALRAELGVSRAAAEAIMRQLPVVQFKGLRKVYVRRADVVAEMERRTFTKDQVVG
jgi:hypothetical protein